MTKRVENQFKDPAIDRCMGARPFTNYSDFFSCRNSFLMGRLAFYKSIIRRMIKRRLCIG